MMLEVEYLPELNWSLIRTGIPLIRHFVCRDFGACDQIQVELSIEDYLRSSRTMIGQRDLDRDICGDLFSLLNGCSDRWQWGAVWDIEERGQPVTTTLQIRLDGAVFALPLILCRPSAWYRVLPGRGTILYRKALLTMPTSQVLSDVEVCCNAEDLEPPLEAALVALIDPSDPFAHPDGPEGSFGRAIDLALSSRTGVLHRAGNQPDAKQLLQAIYTAALTGGWRSVDFRRDYNDREQSVRLLEVDRERGGMCCTDLTILACEALEARNANPIFVLVENGQHALAGVWAGRVAGKFDSHGVCRCLDHFGALVNDGSIYLLDLTRALDGCPLDVAEDLSKWDKIANGFVHAVDVVTVRSGKEFRVAPIPGRPSRADDWIFAYLRRLEREILEARRLDDSTDRVGGSLADDPEELRLDDPDGLFITVRGQQADNQDVTLLEADGTGWLAQRVVEQGGRVAILADGGAGKSYLCRRLVLHFLRKATADPRTDLPVPIWFPLRDLPETHLSNRDDFLRAIARQVGCSLPDLIRASGKRRFIVLLDALDESAASRHIHSPADLRGLTEALAKLSGCSSVLTARLTVFPGDPAAYLPAFDQIRLLGWRQQDFSAYVEACANRKRILFQGGWPEFCKSVSDNPDLRDLAQTPLFARMLVVTRGLVTGMARWKGIDLYHHYTSTCFQRRAVPLGLTIPEAQEVSAEIALSMYLAKTDGLDGNKVVLDLSLALPSKGAAVYHNFVARDLLVHGVFTRDSALLFRFSHLSIQHYFLSRRLAVELSEAKDPRRTRSCPVGTVSTVLAQAPLHAGVITFLAEILLSSTTGVADLDRIEQAFRGVGARQRGVASTRPTTSLRKKFMESRTAVGLPPWRRLFSGECATRQVQSNWRPEDGCRNLAVLLLQTCRSLEELDLTELDFTGQDLSRANLSGSVLGRCDFRGCSLEGAKLDSCDLEYTKLGCADLTAASLQNANLGKCNLSHIIVRSDRFPNLLGATDLDQIDLDHEDSSTMGVLFQCLAQHDTSTDPSVKDWLKQAREYLNQLRDRRPPLAREA